MTRRAKRERGYCTVCRREVSARIPRGGDGTAYVAGYHHGPTSFDARRCPGVGDFVRPLEPGEKPRIVT